MLALSLISVILVALYGSLIIYYKWAWDNMPVWSPPKDPIFPHIHVTVLVPARNEEKNILTCLHSLCRQTYPKDLFEVIVIDDHSTDRTAALVEEMAATSSLRISCIRLADFDQPAVRAYKKFAIETGIKAARGTLVITTDADCWSGPDWLHTMVEFYASTGAKFIAAPVRISTSPSLSSVEVPETAKILGPDNGGGPATFGTGNGGDPVTFDPGNGGDPATFGPGNGGSPASFGPANTGIANSFLYLFQTLDFITLQGITGASVYRNIHSMCNGANLAYEKKAFEEVGGFRGIDKIPSGDDMLLMHKIYKKYPEKVSFLKTRSAIVSTAPEQSWNGFLHQRIRWASKANSYDDKRIFWVLLLVYLVNLLFPLLLIASCWNRWWLLTALLLGVVKTLVEYPFVRNIAGFFGQQRLMVYFPCLQPFHVAYTVIVGWLGQFGSYRWKERKVN